MKFFAWLVGIVALVAGLTFGFDAVRARREEGEIRSKVALLKSHGWPTCGDDMPKGPPEGDNAYLLIAPHIVKNRETVTPREPITKGMDSDALLEPADEPMLRKGLELDRPTLDIVAKAFRERKEFWVPRKWDQGFMMLLPELAAFKGLNRELMGEVTLKVRAGRLDQAREVLNWCHRMQKSTVHEPIFISVLVGRSMMLQEQRCLLRLLQQGQPVMPLLKDAQAEWASWKHDWKPILATELMAGLTSARYLDSNQFWRDQSWPWSLANKDMRLDRYDLKFPVGDSIPKSNGARRKLIQALGRYLEFDKLAASGVTAKHVNDSISNQDELWKDVPMFSNMSVTSSPGSEPTMAAQLELVRLQPEIMGCILEALETKAGKSANSAFDKLSQEKALIFDFEKSEGKIVLVATERGNEVMNLQYPVDLDEKYTSFGSRRKREIDRIEGLLNPGKSKRAGMGRAPGGAPLAVAPAMP